MQLVYGSDPFCSPTLKFNLNRNSLSKWWKSDTLQGCQTACWPMPTSCRNIGKLLFQKWGQNWCSKNHARSRAVFKIRPASVGGKAYHLGLFFAES